MKLADYYLGEPGFVLVPIEHLGPDGMSAEFATLLRERAGWSEAGVALFDAGFRLYWRRSSDLRARTRLWPPPRVRNVGVVVEAGRVRPYAGILNTSTWTSYASDFDPERSHPELVAYLLACGDWMAMTGDVTFAAVRGAAWWLERTDEECEAFAAAASRSPRPDAAALRAISESTGWLRGLWHDQLRPAPGGEQHREIPGTGLRVPVAVETKPQALADACRNAATDAVDRYRTAWRGGDGTAVDALLAWLATDEPPLLVLAGTETLLWDPEGTGDLARLRGRLADADAVAVRAIRDDLQLVACHTRAFLSAVVDVDGLPSPTPELGQGGYTYLHPDRRLIAYDLDDPGIERLHGPPLPYASAMLGARTAHEWGHLAYDAGWVARAGRESDLKAIDGELARELDETVDACPLKLRKVAEADLDALCAGRPHGEGLATLLHTRVPDYAANLVARHFMTEAERETYVRHNVRTLRYEHPAARFWRMLVRYLYEYQYLGPHLAMTSVEDPYAYFVASTAARSDLVDSGILAEDRLRRLLAATARSLATYEVDRTKIRLPPI